MKRNVEKVWGGRYTLGARYLSKNTVYSQFDYTCTLLVLIMWATLKPYQT
jgi:hypothetical protein